MKKILVVLLTVALLLGTFAMMVPASAATSPVKNYDTAQWGELLYTVNFNGDAAFAPAKVTAVNRSVHDYTPSADGKSLVIKGSASATGDWDGYWGGTIAGLPVTLDSMYSMKYMVNSSRNPVKNNSVGIGGLSYFEGSESSPPQFINNYSNHHGTIIGDSRSAISVYGSKQMDYLKWNTATKAPKVDGEGFLTMANLYDVSRNKFTTYYLAADDTWYELQSWTLDPAFEEASDLEGAIMSFMTYAYYKEIDTTIKNVEYYKGDFMNPANLPDGVTPPPANEGGDNNNAGDTTNTDTTTKAPETTTKAPETTKAAEEKKGCGSSIGFAGLALVATVATVGVAKKRKND